jgi:hypothetical protein
MTFLRAFFKNLGSVLLIFLVVAGAVFIACLPVILGEWLGDWVAFVTFGLYFLAAVAAGTYSEQKKKR